MSFKPDLKDAPRQIYSEIMQDAKKKKKQWDKENDDGIGYVFIVIITIVVVGTIISLLEMFNWMG